MATKYISDLTSVTTLSDTDVLVIDDGEHNYKIAWSAIKALLGTVTNLTADPNTGNITITLANGSTLTAKPSDPQKQDKLTFDDSPTAGSNNPVKSGGVKTALDDKLNKSEYVLFTGATQSGAGTQGIVPAPASEGMYLGSGGAWETPDSTPTAGSDKLVTSGGVKDAIDNIEIDVDSAMSDSSENPVQNKVINAALKAGTKATKALHLGFYLDGNGDLCYDE